MPVKKVVDTPTEVKKSASRARKTKTENDASISSASQPLQPQPVVIAPVAAATEVVASHEPVKKASRSKKTPSIVSTPLDTEEPNKPCLDADTEADPTTTTTTTTQDSKKKGRKPRGGKIVSKPATTPPAQPYLTNVVLNLKCSMQDLKDYTTKLNNMIINPLEYNSAAPPEVKYYDGSQPFAMLESVGNGEGRMRADQASEDQSPYMPSSLRDDRGILSSSSANAAAAFGLQNWNPQIPSEPNNASYLCSNCSCVGPASEFGLNESSQSHVRKMVGEIDLEEKDDVNVKDMQAKLKQLKVQLYKNAIQSEKKSACFWCTYDFDNTPCYIPKYEMDGIIYGYGSFCRPECAVAYLMKESIDDSTKFDRYHLLNQIYSKVYDCKKNIKPAPNPHYLLDKFYGNLSIQEYRKLLKTEHLLLVIDKPLTRILPELHEDTDEAFTKLYGIKSAPTNNTSGVYKVKRQSEQPNGPSKASIIRNAFGLPHNA